MTKYSGVILALFTAAFLIGDVIAEGVSAQEAETAQGVVVAGTDDGKTDKTTADDDDTKDGDSVDN